MKPVSRIAGRGVPLFATDIDTDAILPKQFLRRVERSGFGEFLFFEWKKDPEFVLNDPTFGGGTVLIAGRNFGCGSSREHAVWALKGAGFDAVVAPSFGDIFENNSSKNALVLVTLPDDVCRELADRVTAEPSTDIVIDLERETLTCGPIAVTFSMPPRVRHLLLEGLDEVGLTLKHEAEIAAYEATRPSFAAVIPR